MKYIITDKNEVRLGGLFHADMLTSCDGKVVRAGHCRKREDGTYEVWGESIGFRIKAQPEDAKTLEEADAQGKVINHK